MSQQQRSMVWMVFWGMAGWFAGYEAATFAHGIPRDYGMIELLGLASLATLLVALLRSRAH
ncbi:MAG: hypothetical protein RL216_3426 [Pseudomonadota bacterium]|jgi:hypothetical protein